MENEYGVIGSSESEKLSAGKFLIEHTGCPVFEVKVRKGWYYRYKLICPIHYEESKLSNVPSLK